MEGGTYVTSKRRPVTLIQQPCSYHAPQEMEINAQILVHAHSQSVLHRGPGPLTDGRQAARGPSVLPSEGAVLRLEEEQALTPTTTWVDLEDTLLQEKARHGNPGSPLFRF